MPRAHQWVTLAETCHQPQGYKGKRASLFPRPPDFRHGEGRDPFLDQPPEGWSLLLVPPCGLNRTSLCSPGN